MDKQAATSLINEVFNSKFDRALYRRFITELVNQFESKENRWAGNVIPDAYKDHIRQYERLGTYTDPGGEEIELLMVNLRKETALDRARTMQRNFVAHHLKTRGEREAALVAYYHEDQADWRFSLVRMDYRAVQDEESGRVKIQEELTPARRYSFLVGADEPNHTAQSQLHAFLLEDRRNPTLAQLEDAFNIESVTKEFFGKYKELFLDLQDELDRVAKQDTAVRNEFIRCEIDTATFAKKLLGQIVFLYFLQKKGWMGVAPEANWGDGSRTFMRRLFDSKYGSYGNFFNDLLEPLFYNALAVERSGDLYAPLNCKIPFLNGGLFEPTGGYDWRTTDILISNEVFADIFATFDLYNFTVREDEPLEKEVAVDPEMLGKVFENLLEVTDRKSKGAFYTPREIVHYMCQESLINYLDTAVNLREVPVGGEEMAQSSMFPEPPRQAKFTTTEYIPIVPRDDIAVLVRLGELAVEHDTAKETGTKSHKHRLPQSVREHAAALDDALADIKVCDPAIGSGAFPVGMMHEIVRAREVLTTYLGDGSRATCDLKRHAIQESIYGVDIDPSAVDIAKLRLWLSLVVDEESYQSIQPLPNLDYKIVQGNSLLKVEKNLFNEHLFADLDALKRRYFHETHGQEKLKLRAQIDRLIRRLTNSQHDFDFEIYFHEVFDTRLGFDIVVANPPYIDSEEMTRSMPDMREQYQRNFKSAKGNWDLFVIFIEQGVRILKTNGIITYIVPNKLIAAKYTEALRRFLGKFTAIEFRDFSNVNVFKEADVYPMVFSIQKSKRRMPVIMTEMQSKTEINQTVSVSPRAFYSDIHWDRYFAPPETLAIMERLLEYPTLETLAHVYGAATVGEAYKIKSDIIELDSNYVGKYKRFINTGTIDPYLSYWGVKTTRYLNDGYLHPVVSENAIHSLSRNRWEQSNAEKVIIGGMTKELECFYDKGNYLAGKSTTIVMQKSIDLRLLTAILNSKLITFFYRTFFNSLSLSGGYLRVGPPQIRMIPVAINRGLETELISLVERIMRLGKAMASTDFAGSPDFLGYRRRIDEIVYTLYGLSREQIEIIEYRSSQ
ncbi:MAG: Eco57I restriction-modification methylase domain-containing protein [Caldilineaceae bacterium]|nr:Eco57I restriction-modification methylase domain-containing protein [Caldilineaceae bacterium]